MTEKESIKTLLTQASSKTSVNQEEYDGNTRDIVIDPKTSEGYIEFGAADAVKVENSNTAEAVRTILEECGLNPDHYEIVGNAQLRTGTWTIRPDSEEQVGAEGQSRRWRVNVRAKVNTNNAYELSEITKNSILSIWEQAPKPLLTEKSNGNKVLVFHCSDHQIGKSDNGGTPEILKTYGESLQRVVEAIKEHKPDAVHVMMLGDCIEGSSSQNGKNIARSDLTTPEQIFTFQELLNQTVAAISPLISYGELHISVVDGNHDRTHLSEIRSNGYATGAAISVANFYKRGALAEQFNHVHFHVPPEDKGYMTVKVKETTFTMAHGHQWRRGKAEEWISKLGFNRDPAINADFLCHGHYHEAYMSLGARRIVCSGSFEGNSNWFREYSGVDSTRNDLKGALLYLTDGKDFTGEVFGRI